MIHEWTGERARTLRLAKRMSALEFAAHLGLSERTVRRWDTSPVIVPGPFCQACLDTVLNKLTPHERERFETWPTDNGYQERPKPIRVTYDETDPFWTHAQTVAAHHAGSVPPQDVTAVLEAWRPEHGSLATALEALQGPRKQAQQDVRHHPKSQ